MMITSAEIGSEIRNLRKLAGLTQEEVANGLFMSVSYLGEIERGTANPTLKMADRIISFLRSEITRKSEKRSDNEQHLEL